MVQQTKLTSFLVVGAGAGLAAAVPHPQWWNPYKHNHGFSFSDYSFPTYTATPSPYSSEAGSSLAAPTGFSSFPISGIPSGTAARTGTGKGYAYSTSSGFPTGTGSGFPASSSAARSYSYGGGVLSSSVVVSAVAPSASSSGAGSIYDTSNSSSVAATAAGTSSASVATASAASGCTFTDASSAESGKGNCKTIILSGIAVPAGTTLDMTNLNDGTTVEFEGTTTFGYEEWDGPLISFSGSGITITGASGHVINGEGQKWWDGEGSNGGKTKPKFFYAHDLTGGSVIDGLNILNTPVQVFSVDGAENLSIKDVVIDNSAGDTEGGHNTDCYDIGESTGVTITGATCKNQDDCVAINSGTDISFTGGTCSGGHGLSIGSVGGRDDNTVKDVYFGSSTVSDSENGVRVKCSSGDTGAVTNVTYEDITLSGITSYGILIEQNYDGGDLDGTPTTGIPITELTLSNVKGTVSGGDNIAIVCGSSYSCSDWTWTDVSVTGGSTYSDCENVPSVATCS